MKEFKHLNQLQFFNSHFDSFVFQLHFTSSMEVSGREEKRKAYLKKTFCGIYLSSKTAMSKISAYNSLEKVLLNSAGQSI